MNLEKVLKYVQVSIKLERRRNQEVVMSKNVHFVGEKDATVSMLEAVQPEEH